MSRVGAVMWILSAVFFNPGVNSPVFRILPVEANELHLILAPPLPDSLKQQADLDELLRLQAIRTPEQCQRASDEAHANLDSFFGPKHGPLTQSEVLGWSDFFNRITDRFVNQVVDAKKHWKRPRPYIVSAAVHPCLKLEPSDSYPSGHAVLSRIFVRVLSLMDPLHKAAFVSRGHQISLDRVIAGLHYPTDVEAGEHMGDELFEEMAKMPEFNTELSVESHHRASH